MRLFNSIMLVVSFVTLMACHISKSRVSACGVKDPVKNNAWLKKTVDSLVPRTVGGVMTLVSYNGNDYFALRITPMASAYSYMFTCDGTPLAYPADTTLMRILTFSEKAERKVLLKYGIY